MRRAAVSKPSNIAEGAVRSGNKEFTQFLYIVDRDWIIERMTVLQDETHPLGRCRDQDIPDPIGGTEDEFSQTLERIETCLIDWPPLLPPSAASGTNHESRIATRK